jgi:DNA polymerase/3'-5' exonuclease PolX
MGMSNIDTSMFLETNRRIDIMYTKPEEYPFAILYFTGSADFNVKMRNELVERGYTLNEYGVQYIDKKKEMNETFKTEKDIFKYFGYSYVEPENR